MCIFCMCVVLYYYTHHPLPQKTTSNEDIMLADVHAVDLSLCVYGKRERANTSYTYNVDDDVVA